MRDHRACPCGLGFRFQGWGFRIWCLGTPRSSRERETGRDRERERKREKERVPEKREPEPVPPPEELRMPRAPPREPEGGYHLRNEGGVSYEKQREGVHMRDEGRISYDKQDGGIT